MIKKNVIRIQLYEKPSQREVQFILGEPSSSECPPSIKSLKHLQATCVGISNDLSAGIHLGH